MESAEQGTPGRAVRRCAARAGDWVCERTADKYPLTKGYCRTHYVQQRHGRPFTPARAGSMAAGDKLCAFSGCLRALSAKGLCAGHYAQQNGGRPLTPLRSKRDSAVYRAMIEKGAVECLGCEEVKPLAEYSRLSAKGDPRPYCKPCNSERVRLRNHNVTKQFVEELLDYQGGRCAICGIEATGSATLHIDHDHECCPGRGSCGGCVRALVCSNCNTYGLAWYEALPRELRTFDLLNGYLAHPPARRFRQLSGSLCPGT
ncbi:endonuclease domain-containing protein [Streptomyces sp. HUAS MG91]|uniref:Endonuclease domain-containing protein n=1 Tax=Streptomyces tabacisoli TaxID=3156398 RepID=A0AAU8IZB3_9ACTN